MKKKILVISLIVSLVAIAALGATLAYFTDTSTVDNTFTVGNVKIDLKEIIGYENAEPGYGEPGENGKVDFGTMLPGRYKTKAPIIENIGSNAAYVQLKVTINKADAFDQMFRDYDASHEVKLSIADFIKGIDSSWTYAGNVKNADNTRTYTYTYNGPLAAGAATSPLFAGIEIPTFIDGEFANAEIEDFAISIVAEAIQADNFDNAAAAYAELNK